MRVQTQSLVLDVIHQRDICILLSDNKVFHFRLALAKQLHYYLSAPELTKNQGLTSRD
jgi:hypothetical protein